MLFTFPKSSTESIAVLIFTTNDRFAGIPDAAEQTGDFPQQPHCETHHHDRHRCHSQ